MNDNSESLIFPETIVTMRKLETVLRLMVNYFRFKEDAGNLADVKKDLVQLKSRREARAFWGEKHQSDESLVLASITAEDILRQGKVPNIFGWCNIIIEALTDPDSANEADEKWGKEKTNAALNEVRHFLALLG